MNTEEQVKKLTFKEFLALPIEERRKLLEKQASNPEVIKYYEDIIRDEMAWQDRGMME